MIIFNELEKLLLRYINGIKEFFFWEFFVLVEINGIYLGYVWFN